MPRRRLTCGALFAGIGGFCYGFEEVGFKTRWALDIDAEAIATYERNFPGTKTINDDIRALNERGEVLPKVDVLHAGFPCQSFSQAGRRNGFDDERGRVFFEIIKAVEMMGEDKPAVLVLENSSFFLSGEGGMWFETLKSSVQRLGYWFDRGNAVVLDSRKHGGLPQRRPRVFMVAVDMGRLDYNRFSGAEIPEPKERVRLEDILEREVVKEEGYYLSEENRYGSEIMGKAKDYNGLRLFQLRRMEVRAQEPGVCPTLTANMGTGGHNVPFVVDGGRLRRLTERECLLLQGFPANKFRWPDDGTAAMRYRLIGNAVSPPVSRLVAESVRGILEEGNNARH